MSSTRQPDPATPTDPGHVPAPLRGRRWVPVTAVVGGALVTGLLVGGTALASTSDAVPVAAQVSPASGGDTGDSSTAPAAPTDGAAPSAPSDGTAPTPPTGGPGAGGPGAGPGAGGPAQGGPGAEDGSTRVVGTITAVSGSSLTVRTDAGEDVTVALTDDTRFRTSEPTPPTPPAEGATPEAPAEGAAPEKPAAPADGSASAPTAGQRVEVRVADEKAVDVGVVRAHADGTVVSADGGTAVVVTRDGLRVTLDLSATDDTVAVGDEVHATGTASADGESLVVSSVATGR